MGNRFPEINTERFCLRQFKPSDQTKVFEALSDKTVIQYYGVSYFTLDETAIQMRWFDQIYSEGTGIWWAVSFHRHSDLIGACGFNGIKKEHRKGEIGFWLLPAYWKQGIMIEVLPAIIQHAFKKMDLHRIEAVVETENSASRGLLEKLKFNYEGTSKECEVKNEKFISLDNYALINK